MATKNDYTMRKFLENVKAGTVGEQEQKYAEAEIAKLDARNAARKGKETATAKANAPIKDAIKTFVAGNPDATAKDIADAVGQTTAKVSALATQLVKEGALVTKEVKAASGKGKVKAYSVV